MSDIQKSSKIYHSHRENQRERILEVAERLLIQKGIDNVSLSEIARETRMTRATLYEYFPNKQEMAWAIFQKIMEDIYVAHASDLSLPQGNGFQRLENFMGMLVGLLETHPEHLRFIVEFNTLYAREGNPARVRQGWAGGYDMLTQIIREGKTDGSLRQDLNPDLLAAALLNLTAGMNSRFALLGELIHEEYGQPVQDMYREICRAFLRGIQSSVSSQEIAE
jgi:AcrR family transcriptional regulator